MSSSVSGVYAGALFSLAREMGDETMQSTRDDLRQLAVQFTLNPELTRLLSLPTLPFAERREIAKKVFGDEGLACRLLFLLIDHERVSYLSEIADAYDAQMMDYQSIERVYVTTAVALTPSQKERLREVLSKKLGREIRIAEHIDSSILGGVIVQYGDTRIDNSLKFRLDSIRERLS